MAVMRFHNFLALMLLPAGCGDAQTERAAISADAAPSDTANAAPSIGQNLAANLLAYMHRLEHRPGIPIDTLRNRFRIHAAMLEELLVQYEREMQALTVERGPIWRATVDSLRGDLATLPDANDAAFLPILSAHQRRVDKLIQFHEAMIRSDSTLTKAPAGAMPAERDHPD